MKRYLQRLTHVFMHLWSYQWLAHKQTFFHERKCRVCGKTEVQQCGMLGNGSWRDITKEWKWQWEKESYEAAKPAEKL